MGPAGRPKTSARSRRAATLATGVVVLVAAGLLGLAAGLLDADTRPAATTPGASPDARAAGSPPAHEPVASVAEERPESAREPPPAEGVVAVSGRILGASGSPVEAARVRLVATAVPVFEPAFLSLYRAAGAVAVEREAAAERDGRFRVEAPAPRAAVLWTLSLSARDCATEHRLRLDLVAGNVHDLGTLRLQQGLAASVRVLGPGDLVPEKARVGVLAVARLADVARVLGEEEPESMIPVGKDGLARLTGLAPGFHVAIAEAPGLARTATAPFEPGDAASPPVVEIRLEGGVALRGTVGRSKGQPIAGARVVATPNAAGASRFPPARTVADAEGRFAFESIPAERIVEVVATSMSGELGKTSAQGGRTDFFVPIVGSLMIHGSARDAETGYPVADLWAAALPEPFDARIDVRRLEGDLSRAKTDANGSVSLRVAGSGMHRVVAWGGDWAPSMSIPTNTSRGTVVVHMRRGASVSGRVLGPDRAPVEDAEVRVLFRDPLFDGASFRRAFDVAAARSGADGSWSASGCPEGSLAIEASHPRLGVASARMAVEGTEAACADLVLAPAGALRGRLLGASPSFPVRITAAREDGMRFEIWAPATDGFALHALPPGLYRVAAEQGIGIDALFAALRGAEPATKRFGAVLASVRGGATAEVVLELEGPRVGTIRGVVSVERGSAAGWTVAAVSERDDGTCDFRGTLQGAPSIAHAPRTPTTSEGRFEIRDLPEGRYRLFALGPGAVASVRAARAAESVVVLAETTAERHLATRQSGRLRARCVGDGGEPAGSVAVELQVPAASAGSTIYPAGLVSRTSSGPRGVIDFGELPPGPYELWSLEAGRRVLRGRAEVGFGEVAVVTLVLGNAADPTRR